jgi:hypothetical protein
VRALYSITRNHRVPPPYGEKDQLSCQLSIVGLGYKCGITATYVESNVNLPRLSLPEKSLTIERRAFQIDCDKRVVMERKTVG